MNNQKRMGEHYAPVPVVTRRRWTTLAVVVAGLAGLIAGIAVGVML